MKPINVVTISLVLLGSCNQTEQDKSTVVNRSDHSVKKNSIFFYKSRHIKSKEACNLVDSAISLAEDGNYVQALNIAKKANVIEPNNAFILNEMANCLLNNGDSSRSFSMYRKSLQLDSDNIVSISDYGFALNYYKCYPKALKILSRGISVEDSSNIKYVIYLNIAQTYCGLFRFDSAKFYAEKAIQSVINKPKDIQKVVWDNANIIIANCK
jgi:tetratricopeptide (TPR) repeat protein